MCTIGSGENCAGPRYSLYSSSVSKDWEAHPVNKSMPHNEKSRPIFFIDNASARGVLEDCAQTHRAPWRPFWPQRPPLVSESEEQDHWNKPPAKTRRRIEAQISSGRAYAHSRLIATTIVLRHSWCLINPVADEALNGPAAAVVFSARISST